MTGLFLSCSLAFGAFPGAFATASPLGQETAENRVELSEEEKAQNALEAEFETTMTGCELRGYFTMGKVDPKTPLSEERYVINSVKKMAGDRWLFNARIQYGERDITVPIPITVKWAGDTPVITVTDMNIPFVGTYTARVLFYRGQYAGTWSGIGYGGQMFGEIVTAKQLEAEKDQTGDKATDKPPEKTDDKDGEEKAPNTPKDSGVDAEPVLVSLKNPSSADDSEAGIHWPSFRGPQASGISEGHSLPTQWDISSGKNVKWKQKIDGLCHSSPVVWGDLVFMTSAERKSGEQELVVGLYGSIDPVDDEGEHDFTVYCLDKETGETYWKNVANTAVPAVMRHPKGSHAASTPVTDGRYVVAMFASEGLYCYSIDGELIWKKDLGVLDSGYFMVPDAQWGFASSPILHEDTVILLCDIQKNSYLAVLDLETGDELWRTKREDVPTWGTPTLLEVGDVRQIIVNGYRHSGAYDYETGEEIWKLNGGGDIPVPTPIVAHDMIFLTSAHGRLAPIFAIDTHAQGELAMEPADCEAMVWSQKNQGNYMQTPIIYGDYLYTCADSGVLRCYEAKTGKRLYSQRLSNGNGFTASAVAGDNKVYFTSEVGEIHVVKAGPEYESLAVNDMGSSCMATPAISEGVLLIRTENRLIALEESGE